MSAMFALLALFVVAVVCNQFIEAVNEQYTTETAVIYSAADRASFRGVYIRDESVIKKSYRGVISYPSADGSKVANGSVVAYVYSSIADIENRRRITALEEEIQLLEASQNPGTVLTAQPEFISSLISEQYQAVATRIAKRDVSDIKQTRDQLLTLMNIYQISVNQEENYDERITALAAELSDLRAAQQPYKYAVKSPDAGYFVSYTDGYEDILKTKDGQQITAELIKDVIENEQSMRESRGANEIGKLVEGYNWKIAGIIDNSDSIYNPGDTVTLKFASTPDNVTAVIEALDPTENPEEWVMVLRCEEMTFDLVRKRVERVEMTLNDFEGLKVPRSAIRFNENNEKGCYVLWGQRVLFKKVDVIFDDNEHDYILSRLTSDEEYVCVYDDIIIEGVDTAAYKAGREQDEENDTEQTTAAETTEETVTEAETVSETTAQESETEQSEAPVSEGEIHFE